MLLDASYCKARFGHQVVSQAVVVAIGVAADGRSDVLGFDAAAARTRDSGPLSCVQCLPPSWAG